MGYAKDIYRQARQTLDTRREHAQQTVSMHKAEAYAKLPRLVQIERELADTGLAAAKVAISGGANTDDIKWRISRLELKSTALQQERVALLTQHGYPPNYLAISYACPTCEDTGYIAQTRCKCMEQLLRTLAYQQVSENAGDHCRFETFKLDYYPNDEVDHRRSPREAMKNILTICQNYAATFSPQGESLLFFGNTGLGKTHLSLSIAFEVIEKGHGVYYASCQRLMDKLQAQQFGRAGSDETDYQQLALECDLLILDDLGAEFSTAFTIAALQNIVNVRLGEQRPTIISTNFDMNLLSERYGERLVSRLFCGYQPLPFTGEDIRKLKRYAR